MNILIIVLSLICAYVLFMSISYVLARLIFPKIEVEDDDPIKQARAMRAKHLRRLTRAIR
jgi:hypothetical protein